MKKINAAQRIHIRFTKEGFDTLQREYDALLLTRPHAVEDLRKAREMGDLKENGYYKASRAKLSFIDSRLRRWKFSIQHALIIEKTSSENIDIESTVTLTEGNKKFTYTIVGDLESDPAHGKISLLSPLGKALLGKKAGETVSFYSPNGKKEFIVVNVL